MICEYSGCHEPAVMIPVLIVHSHPLSVGRFDGVRSALGVAVCRRHFNTLRPREFLQKDAIRLSIEADFRQRAALPDFDKAKLDFYWHKSPEFAQYIAMRERARQGAALPADIIRQ